MTDVRLTATTPDGQVVYVLANAKGELKLEEPIDNSFDGNLDGNLNVTGSASFAGQIDIDGVGGLAGYGWAIANNGGLANKTPSGSTVFIENTGAASFEGSITTGGYDLTDADTRGLELRSDGLVRAQRQGSAGNSAIWQGYNGITVTSTITSNGSVTFAGGNAGFTSEGHLWCKVAGRNQLVMLNNLVNGLGEWIEYTPPSRKDLVQEKLEQWSEKDKPAVSPLEQWSEKDKPAVSPEDAGEN